MPTALSLAPAELRLAELTETNRPTQLPLLTRIAGLLSASTAVTHLIVRGSLASGTADRLSDVDFVVGIHDRDLPAFALALNDLMTVAGGALLPGWRDTIVADLGGIGFVFLVQHEGKLRAAISRKTPAPALLIDDTSLAIRTLTVMARQAVDLGRGRDAVRFARQGRQQTRVRVPAVRGVGDLRIALAVECGEVDEAAERARTADTAMLDAAGRARMLVAAAAAEARRQAVGRAAAVLREAEEAAPLRLRLDPFARELLIVLPTRAGDAATAALLRGGGRTGGLG
ncbi:hypothetical protein [Streptomyces marincola]|uniref:Nucleotidyltransferase domain-containing protein n=1 Tax=Streptomyces marincola TaxID=2878388 RepID=A0A1W7D185_9ACTN|nr:hypothetical protein [Streptomyces marincola]ARQ70717.1 hypothetical protein CAG99_19415 [Streptomyces marincola]